MKNNEKTKQNEQNNIDTLLNELSDNKKTIEQQQKQIGELQKFIPNILAHDLNILSSITLLIHDNNININSYTETISELLKKNIILYNAYINFCLHNLTTPYPPIYNTTSTTTQQQDNIRSDTIPLLPPLYLSSPPPTPNTSLPPISSILNTTSTSPTTSDISTNLLPLPPSPPSITSKYNFPVTFPPPGQPIAPNPTSITIPSKKAKPPLITPSPSNTSHPQLSNNASSTNDRAKEKKRKAAPNSPNNTTSPAEKKLYVEKTHFDTHLNMFTEFNIEPTAKKFKTSSLEKPKKHKTDNKQSHRSSSAICI